MTLYISCLGYQTHMLRCFYFIGLSGNFLQSQQFYILYMLDFKVATARAKMQREAKDAVRLAKYIATLIVTVGGGKGKVMIDLAMELIAKYDIKSILYVCDNRRLRDDTKDGFPEQLQTWGTPELRKIVTLECYQTTRKWEGRKFDLLLADEADFAMTTEYCKVFFNNDFRFKILVTGTLKAEKKKLIQEIAPIVYKFSTVQAEDAGVVNKSNYWLYNYKMTESESRTYIKWTRALMVAMNDGSNKDTINFLANKRREVLTTLDSSYGNVRKIMKWLWNKNKLTRLVIFCERRTQADRVCKHSFHGENQKEDNLTKFQTGEISGISVVSKIKRGINLKNANTAIFESITSSSTEFEQRNGRMKRLKTSEVAEVIFMLPWYQTDEGTWKPTVIQKYIQKATVNIGSSLKDLNL